MNKNTLNKNNRAVVILLVIILLIGLGYYTNNNRQANQTKQGDSNSPSSQQNKAITNNEDATSQGGILTRMGTFMRTDNPNKGNFIIQTATSNFYIFTSRDYSSLLGKQVELTANGTTENFTLVDIVEAK